jgi:surface protein
MPELGIGLEIPKSQNINNMHVSIWKTDNAGGISANNQIKLPFYNAPGGVDCNIYWGDGTNNHVSVWNDPVLTHTYPNPGTYPIRIIGQVNGFRFNDGGDKTKLISIENGGSEFNIGNDGAAFYGCSNLTKVKNLNIEGLTYLWATFANCSVLTDIGYLNTDSVQDMSFMFQNCVKFNQNINYFNTSLVENMWSMFYGCSIYNQPVSNFNTSKVKSMRYMFGNCIAFNQPVSNFDTSLVDNMQGMFYGCSIFNQSVSNFNTSKVTTMNRMFFSCLVFNQSLNSFDTGLVNDMEYMLYSCIAFNQSLAHFNISLVTTMNLILDFASSWSNTNYSNALIAWAASPHQNNVPFKCVSKYEVGAAASRTALQTDGWIINDLGAA